MTQPFIHFSPILHIIILARQPDAQAKVINGIDVCFMDIISYNRYTNCT